MPLIVSEDTLRFVLEANASLSAWYHEFVRASRDQTPVQTPSEESRKAFLQRMGSEFPELAAVVKAVDRPRMYVPPPISFAPTAALDQAPGQPSVDKPPTVNPLSVKY